MDRTPSGDSVAIALRLGPSALEPIPPRCIILVMWTCSKCSESLDDQFDACWRCGTGKDGSRPRNPALYSTDDVGTDDVGTDDAAPSTSRTAVRPVARRTRSTRISAEQNLEFENQVVRIGMTGGIIGLLSGDATVKLEEAIQRANLEGWRAAQVLPALSGNLLTQIFRWVLLLATLFLYTHEDGYLALMERSA